MIDIRFAIERLHDLFDVRVQQHVVIALFLEQSAGVNELGSGINGTSLGFYNIYPEVFAVFFARYYGVGSVMLDSWVFA